MITPLQTKWNGILFRSRTEARWARFFDELQIPYEYEKEGYALSSGWYLPDFWLPEQDCWFEVKGSNPTEKEQQLMWQLCRGTGKLGFIHAGPPPILEGNYRVDRWAVMYEARLDEEGNWKNGMDHPFYWCECRYCGALGLQFEGRSARIVCCKANSDSLEDKAYSHDSRKLIAAYSAARSERFGT